MHFIFNGCKENIVNVLLRKQHLLKIQQSLSEDETEISKVNRKIALSLSKTLDALKLNSKHHFTCILISYHYMLFVWNILNVIINVNNMDFGCNKVFPISLIFSFIIINILQSSQVEN